MESEHFVGKIAQKALIEKDGKILLSRHPADAKWDLPGGRLHFNEQPQDGLRREILEELGIEVEVLNPFFSQMTKADSTGEERYFVAFKTQCKNPDADFVFQKEEVAEVCWIGKNEVESTLMFEVCRNAIRTYFTQ